MLEKPHVILKGSNQSTNSLDDNVKSLIKQHEEITNINSVNRLVDMITSIRRDIESQIIMIISVILSVTLGLLLSKGEYLWAIIVFEGIIILITIFIMRQNKDIEKLKMNVVQVVELSKSIKQDLTSIYKDL